MQIQDFLKRLKGEQRGSGEQYMACCPAHGDTKPSLSVTERDGKILVHCQAGCTTEAVISAMGLTMQDLFDDPKPKPQSWIFLREHIYYDENSEPIAKKQLYDKGDGTKTGIWYRFENGNYIKNLNGLRMPLYNLPVLTDKEGAYIAGGENSTVYIAEGEKDAQTLFDMGYAGTTSPNGAGSKWKTEYNKYVTGRDVVILADNDKAGQAHAEHTADALLTVAKSVKLIPASAIYPNIQNKGDISDIAAKFGIATAREMLDKAVAGASYINAYSQALPESCTNKINPRSGAVKRDLVLLHPDKNDRYGWHDRGQSIARLRG